MSTQPVKRVVAKRKRDVFAQVMDDVRDAEDELRRMCEELDAYLAEVKRARM